MKSSVDMNMALFPGVTIPNNRPRQECRLAGKALVLIIVALFAFLLSAGAAIHGHQDQEIGSALDWRTSRPVQIGRIVEPKVALFMAKEAKQKFQAAHPEWKEAVK